LDDDFFENKELFFVSVKIDDEPALTIHGPSSVPVEICSDDGRLCMYIMWSSDRQEFRVEKRVSN
jgi:hypothetical protein